ncbi:50S ribosomal protein L17 [bacterium]|nr:50S ribosomal protein L17 [bacterium]
MRHRKHRQKLSRPTGHRRALLRNLAIGLIEHERIRTTEAKAKVLRPFIERLVTLGKKGEQHHRRRAFSALGKKVPVHKLFEDIAPRFEGRPGGYTRIIRDDQRAGDGAWMAYIEFVEQGAAASSAPAETAAAEA